MKKSNLLLVEDHQILREILKKFLKEELKFDIVAEASHVSEAEEILAQNQIDIVLLDIEMPDANGFDLLNIIKKKYPQVSTIILSMHLDRKYIQRAVDMGVNGYLHKDASTHEVLAALKAVSNGDSYFSQNVVKVIMDGVRKTGGDSGKTGRKKLTSREKEILKMVVNGFNNAEIAKKLSISVRTVENHRFNMLRKIGAKNTPELVRYSLENRILED